MASLKLRSVRKRYGSDALAVDDLDLDVADGQFAVVVGPSGCGKSTTLRLVAGLENADEGTIWIGDRDVTHAPAHKRDVAVVFQNYALYPHMTVADNIGFGLRMRGVPRTERDRLVEETARSFGLDGVLGRYPAQLSGGQRQRVALGRATVRDPAIFLLDEPLSNLDAQMRNEVRVELRALQQRLAATFVFVTHDQVEALTLADVIAVMKDGVLQQFGTPREIYHAPANKFVASFIGSPRMNFFDGRIVTRDDGGTCLQSDRAQIPVPGLADVAGGLPAELTVGIRPEHLRVDPEGPIELEVLVVEEYGGHAYVHGVVAGHPVVSTCDPRVAPAPGQGVRVVVVDGHEHLFDRSTGDRIEVGGPVGSHQHRNDEPVGGVPGDG